MKSPRHIADNTRLKSIYDLLYSQIATGELKAGERLPTEQELATRVGCSATTVATAMRMLVKEGLIERRKRAGTFVQKTSAAKTKTSFLGAIIFRAMPIYANNIFVPISQEIGHRAELAGHGFVVHDPGYRAEQTRAEVAANLERMTKKLIELDVIGVFVLPQEIEDDSDESLSSDAIAKLDAAGIPVVLLDRDIYRFPRRSKYDLVSIDNMRAGYVITEHLLSLGRRRIDFLSVATYSSAGNDRLEGYKRAVRAHGIEPASRTVHIVDHYDDETFHRVLRSDADALVVVRDGLASSMIQAAHAEKIRVPEDLSIVGFDDLPQSRYLVPALTTIRQPARDFGEQAVTTMFDRIKHLGRRPVDVRVQLELIVRRSCGAPAPNPKAPDLTKSTKH